MKNPFIFSIVCLIVFLSACLPVKLIPPTQFDADRMQEKFPGYTLSELNRGKGLFEQNCTKCHGLKNPASKSEEQWNKIVPKMVNRLNKKEKMLLPSDQQEAILRFLITMGSKKG